MSIQSFLYSIITEDDNRTLFKLKDKYLEPKEAKYLEFTKDFYAQYNKLPDVGTVETKFGIQLISNKETTDYWYKEIFSKYQTSVIELAIIESARNKDKALDIMQQAIIDHSQEIDTKIVDLSNTKDRAKNYRDRKGTMGITHLSTGNDTIDLFSSGFKKADLWTLGGFEGSGKSWFLFRMAVWVDMWMQINNIKKNIIIFSGEMEAYEVADRIDSIKAELPYAMLSRGELSKTDERKYLKYLRSMETNIKIIDSFDGMKDIAYLQTIYRPAVTFIDGSHLLASTYEWQEIARVTADMKKLSRNQKIPIINTTHLKSDKGKSAKGGSIDDFAYTKGYTRDSDIVGVLFASDMMQINNQIGIDWVKVRRGNRSQIIWENDHETGQAKIIETRTGQDIIVDDDGSAPIAPTSSRGKKAQIDY